MIEQLYDLLIKLAIHLRPSAARVSMASFGINIYPSRNIIQKLDHLWTCVKAQQRDQHQRRSPFRLIDLIGRARLMTAVPTENGHFIRVTNRNPMECGPPLWRNGVRSRLLKGSAVQNANQAGLQSERSRIWRRRYLRGLRTVHSNNLQPQSRRVALSTMKSPNRRTMVVYRLGWRF